MQKMTVCNSRVARAKHNGGEQPAPPSSMRGRVLRDVPLWSCAAFQQANRLPVVSETRTCGSGPGWVPCAFNLTKRHGLD